MCCCAFATGVVDAQVEVRATATGFCRSVGDGRYTWRKPCVCVYVFVARLQDFLLDTTDVLNATLVYNGTWFRLAVAPTMPTPAVAQAVCDSLAGDSAQCMAFTGVPLATTSCALPTVLANGANDCASGAQPSPW